MGLGGIVYLWHVHEQDVGAVAVGVEESERNLVDVLHLAIYDCPRRE